ncbi:MAG: TIM barrel protein [Planctomycetes bacterium]|nr:TIM barrel protein [Planctomycetota bacterium]
MDRRSFLQVSSLAAVGTSLEPSSRRAVERGAGGFRLKYAPHLGMFRHHAGDDPLDQIAFMADEGFRAFEDNGMAGRSEEMQEKIGKHLRDREMEMGVFVAHAEWRDPGVSFVTDSDAARSRIAADMKRAVDVAARCGAKWCTVVPGPLARGVELAYQTANVIDNLRRAAEICEPAGLVMVLEPLNPWRDHPGLFLTKVPQAFEICRAVDSPSCKILDDLYHQQITEGNLIPNLERAWSEIAYFQVGDNPGRCEPGTGEINYRNVFRAIHARTFDGIVGMEHGNSGGGKAGERAVIEAYRAADAF